MENNSNFEERFNLVMELNQTLEEIGNLNKQIISSKYEYAQLLNQNILKINGNNKNQKMKI